MQIDCVAKERHVVSYLVVMLLLLMCGFELCISSRLKVGIWFIHRRKERVLRGIVSIIFLSNISCSATDALPSNL